MQPRRQHGQVTDCLPILWACPAPSSGQAMPLVVLCGHPCSGKSHVAAQLAEMFRQKGVEVVVVDEASLHLERNAAYRGEWVAHHEQSCV